MPTQTKRFYYEKLPALRPVYPGAQTHLPKRSALFRLVHKPWLRRGATAVAVALSVAGLASAVGALL